MKDADSRGATPRFVLGSGPATPSYGSGGNTPRVDSGCATPGRAVSYSSPRPLESLRISSAPGLLESAAFSAQELKAELEAVKRNTAQDMTSRDKLANSGCNETCVDNHSQSSSMEQLCETQSVLTDADNSLGNTAANEAAIDSELVPSQLLPSSSSKSDIDSSNVQGLASNIQAPVTGSDKDSANLSAHDMDSTHMGSLQELPPVVTECTEGKHSQDKDISIETPSSS